VVLPPPTVTISSYPSTVTAGNGFSVSASASQQYGSISNIQVTFNGTTQTISGGSSSVSGSVSFT